MSDVICGVDLGSFWLMLLSLGPNCEAKVFCYKFSLETRLESESFEPLIDFPAFMVKKLFKINKLINYLIIRLIKYLFTLDHNFSTPNCNRSSKVSKKSDCSLVSNKNFSEILPSNGLGPGAGEVDQDGLKVLQL